MYCFTCLLRFFIENPGSKHCHDNLLSSNELAWLIYWDHFFDQKICRIDCISFCNFYLWWYGSWEWKEWHWGKHFRSFLDFGSSINWQWFLFQSLTSFSETPKSLAALLLFWYLLAYSTTFNLNAALYAHLFLLRLIFQLQCPF